MIILELEVTPTFCNEWPTLEINHNEKLIFKEQVIKKEKYKFYLNPNKTDTNKLEIGMCNKKFGKNGIWDTKSINGKITEDKTIELNSCKINDVDVKDLMLENQFHVNIVDQQPIYHPSKIKSNGIMNYNGAFYLTYDLPLYNSLTNQKWKKSPDDSLSYFSNHTLVFHYEQDRKLINEIENICNEIEKKLSC